MKTIYFDNAATAPVKYWNKDYAVFGNPNSTHAIGREANKALEEARARIKKALGVKGGKVIIGSSASQLVRYIGHFFTWEFGSKYEHESFEWSWFCDIKDLKKLEERLTEYCYDSKGFPTAIAWMLNNNITGSRFPVEEVGKICHKHDAYYIMDCTASIGHTKLPDNIEDFCDCVLASSHKFGCEIGTGFMWVSDRMAKQLDLEENSYEEYGLIPGTPNVSGAVAMSYALEHAVDTNVLNGRIALWKKLTSHLIYKLDLAEIPFNFVTPTENYTPAINAITFPGINADALATFLSSKGIYISAGHSACENNSQDATRVLEAFGLTKQEASETVRISFNEDNTNEEIDAFVEGVKEFRDMFC